MISNNLVRDIFIVNILPFTKQDHDMFRESARKFFRDVLHPQHKKFEADGRVRRIII